MGEGLRKKKAPEMEEGGRINVPFIETVQMHEQKESHSGGRKRGGSRRGQQILKKKPQWKKSERKEERNRGDL